MGLFSKIFGKPSGPVLYTLFSARPSSDLGSWAPNFPEHTEVVGYSSLGHFFLRSPDDQDYIVLHPFKRAAKSYGSFESVEEFETEILKEPGFDLHVLRSDHVAELFQHLGPLAEDQVYIPKPYPFLGGSEALETYEKGDAWVFMQVVAHMHGLDGSA
nr:T6SS immunity protein Tdi1 domain-containing protein [Pseudomonas folii]